MSIFNVLDCFCGLGGLSLGAELAGHHVVGGIDVDPIAIETYSRVFPGKKAICRDLLTDSPKEVLKSASLKKGDIDVLVGGPPCQPYSINNHGRGTHDARCGLVDSYLEIVSILRPSWLVIENVPGFASIEKGKFLKALLGSLQKRGYECDHTILDARIFGVPQSRRRLVIIGSLIDCEVDRVISSLRSLKIKNNTVRNAIGDLPVKASESAVYATAAKCDFQKEMRTARCNFIQAHISAGLGEVNMQRIKHVPEGGNWRDIPRELLPAGMQRARLSDHTTRYGRLSNEKSAHTLLTKCDPHWGRFLHPTQDRVITVREAARLQSIPDHVEFPKSLIASYRLLGNAVPPLLAKGIFNIISDQ
jgi:DNA (cytosine-5)-methyltransferase 1